jgi:hypothetical protein
MFTPSASLPRLLARGQSTMATAPRPHLLPLLVLLIPCSSCCSVEGSLHDKAVRGPPRRLLGLVVLRGRGSVSIGSGRLFQTEDLRGQGSGVFSDDRSGVVVLIIHFVNYS